MGDGKSWAGSCQSRKWSDVLDSSVEAGLKTGASEAIAIFQMRGLVFESRVSEDIFVDDSFVQRCIHRVPCGHEVVM
uniref:Uncharacterized protein n=1 Tax=Rangifer tarandus platyrhynchus TaxID=3082113 RepID=A0ACB0FAJ1_RANTA|nr:unnamed protein product [Rangifer tarandus platyrhynchus]